MQGPIVFENQGVIRSCGDLSYAGGENLRGGVPIGSGAVSELPPLIRSKSMQRAIVLDYEGVVLANKAGLRNRERMRIVQVPNKRNPGKEWNFSVRQLI